jgi:hypothetical protein
MATDRNRWLGSRAEAYTVTAVISLAWLWGLGCVGRVSIVADELFHRHEIVTLLGGKLEIVNRLTMLPGYHVVIALLARLTGAEDLEALRLLSALISVPVIAAFYATARQLSPRFAAVATLQLAFLPILFPLLFLLYTDAFSLLLVLGSVLLALRHRRHAAAVVALVSVLVRQSNILCLAFVLGLIYLEDHGPSLSRDRLGAALRQNVLFVLGLAGFAVFAVVNGGVTMGDQSAHPLQLSLGNVYLFLFLYFFLALPVNLAGLRRALARLADPRVLAAALLLYGVFMLTFVNDHPYNQITVRTFKYISNPPVGHAPFLRNELLHLATRSAVTRTVFFVPVLLSCLVLATTRLVQPRFLLLYPLLLALLTPSWLIEQRYSLVPLVLLLLARERRSPALEYATAALGLLASVCVAAGIGRQLFFL